MDPWIHGVAMITQGIFLITTSTGSWEVIGVTHIFRNALANELVLVDGISLDSAIQTVQQAFWAYAAYGLLNNYSSRYLKKSVGTRARIRNAVKRVPFAKQFWHNTLSRFPWGGGRFSLQALNRASSPYYKDFSSIYRSVLDESVEP